MRSAWIRKTTLGALLLVSSGCARSAIELEPEESFAQRDAGDGNEDQPDIEDGPALPGEEDASDDDASDPGAPANDASNAASDAAGGSDGDGATNAPAPDASMSAPADASSGTPDASPEAGSGADASVPAVEAGSGSSCNVLSCTNDCAISGPFRCCTERDTCGCTWAPGAYCL